MPPTQRQLDLGWRIALIVGAVYAVVMIGVAAYRARAPYEKGVGTSDYVTFFITSRHFLRTGEITPEAGVRNYLPFFTLLMAPLAVFPCWMGAALMATMSAAAVVLSLAMMLRALTPRHRGPPLVTAGLPVLVAIPFIHACLVLGQVSILIGLLCLLTWWLVAVGRRWPAGLPLAIAILVKPFLITLLVFLALKRQWRTVASTVGCTAVLGAGLTFAAMRPQAWIDAHRDYYHRVLARQTPLAMIASDKPRYQRYNNESLAIVLRRVLTDTQAGHSRKPFTVNLADLPVRVPQIVYIGLMVAIAALTIFVGRHPPDRIEPERAHFEFAMFLLWGLFGSPIVWTHYFPIVLYPLVLLTVQRVRDRQDGYSDRLLLVAWVFWIVAAVSLVTEGAMLPYLRAVGIHLWAAIFVWAAMVRCAVRIAPIHTEG